ncbi:MAG: hypothetical protein KBD37_06510, partial [Burkholderiales bacterium]|nr:hypothetical protein [Burkholderiales bacterium]
MFNIGSKRIGNNGRVAQGEPETSSVNKISEIFNDLTKLTHNQLRTLINAVLVNDVNRFSQQSIEHRLYNSLITLLYGATRNNHKSSKFVVQFMAIAYICLNGVEQSFNTQSTNFKYDNFVNWLYTSVDTKNYLRRINFTIIKLDSIEAIKRNLAYQSVEFKIDRQTFSLPVNLFINVQNNAQVCQKVFHQLSQLSHYQLGSLLKAVSAGDIQLVQGQEICQNIYPDFMLLINYNIANNGYYTEDFLQFMMLTFIYFNGIEKSFYPYNHTFQYNAFIKWLGTNDNYKKLNINMELINLQNTNLISHNVTTRNIDFKIKEQTISLPYRLFAHSPTIPGNRTNQQLGGATQALNKRRSIKYTYIDNRGYEDGIVITSGSDNKKFSSLAIPTVIEYSANARNTERFEGAFNSESETYNGILTYKNGNLFKGQLKHDLRHGLGIYTNQATKVSITGEWSENKLLLNETFTINYPNNDSITVEEFEGELDSNNRFCGIVKLFFSNGTSYRGKLKNGLATEGTFTNLLSHEICGTWENNQLDISKPFTLTYPNKGSLKVEEFNGDITPTGRINGEGKFVFADGASYHGKIEYNVMCGRGIYTNSNGMKFEGGWEGNKLIKDQPFKIVFPNGKTLEVISCEGDIDYDLGIVSGRVTMLYFEGEYSGYIKQNSKHGEGIYTDNKGVKFKGKWSDDKAVDKFEVSYPAEHKFQLKLTKDTVLQFDKFTGEITNECEPKKGTFTAIDKPNDKFEVEFYPHAKIGTYITPEKSIKGKWRKECRALNSQFTIIYHTDPGLRRKKFVGSVTEDLEPLCGIMEYQDNSLYEGRFKNNFRDGISSVTTPSFKAVISYTDGQITSGTSIKYTNYIIGSSIAAELSIENNPNQMKYTGSVNAELEPHGFGIAEYVNGDRFEGEFNHGFRDSGVLIRINRDKLEWKDGKLSSITYPDGDSIRRVINEHDNSTSWIYKYIKTGEEFELNVIIKDDITTREYQSDNKTIIVAQDGTRKYRRIRMAPKVYNVPLVEYTFANGEVYRGNMDENGKKHGFGKLQYPNGDVYEGNFSQDKFEGHGTYISAATNEIYKGLFKNGERHGRGIISYPNGDTYKGEFCNGKKEKEWIYTSHDDKYTFIETYVSGSIPEPVRLYLYEGVSPFSYSGQLEDNQPNGLGESFSSFLNIEVRYTGIFKNGQQEGYGSLKDSEG